VPETGVDITVDLESSLANLATENKILVLLKARGLEDGPGKCIENRLSDQHPCTTSGMNLDYSRLRKISYVVMSQSIFFDLFMPIDNRLERCVLLKAKWYDYIQVMGKKLHEDPWIEDMVVTHDPQPLPLHPIDNAIEVGGDIETLDPDDARILRPHEPENGMREISEAAQLAREDSDSSCTWAARRASISS
jgi:hypothetical protein